MAESTTPSAGGALAGLRVIDLSRVLAGPHCTQMLGDQGADIIKIEPPAGDDTRGWGPPWFKDEAGEAKSSGYFVGLNRNKRALSLDLTQPRGREVLLRLLEEADVLIENFKPDTLIKWGLGYDEVLKERFPRLIYCQISGFGPDGPLGGFPGYDAVAQAWSGIISLSGHPETGPVRCQVPLVDVMTATNAAVAILMALYERERSGQGQAIEVTLYDSALAMIYPYAAGVLNGGQQPPLTGNGHALAMPYGLYETRTGPLFLGTATDSQYRKAMTVLGRPDLARDPRFATNRDRVKHREELLAILREIFLREDSKELGQRLLAAGVPAGPIQTVAAAMAHPHTRHRGMALRREGIGLVGSPLRLKRTPPEVRRNPPDFAADTRAVLEEAGFAPAEIEALIGEGVVVMERRHA